MSNWTHKWYDPRGAWDAEFIAEAFIRLIEGGYIPSSDASRRDASRRLQSIQAELRGVRAALEHAARGRDQGTRTMSLGRR